MLEERLPRILSRLNALRLADGKLTPALLNGLERATRAYLDARMVPHLSPRGLNILGFSLAASQVYASLYCARHLAMRRPEAKTLLVFGGPSVVVSAQVAMPVLARHANGAALCVAGDG